MSEFQSLIDCTSFGIVRSYLNRPGSPITDVLFVESDYLMCEVAEVLTRPVSDLRRQRLLRWFEAGQVSIGIATAAHPDMEPGVRTLDVWSIDPHARCDVLHLPPYYLVHLAAGHGSGFVASWDR